VANIKITQKVLEELYCAIAKGANLTDAAGFIGVSRQAIYTLLHKERAKPYSKILDKIEASRALFRKSLQDRIVAHGKSSWQAALFSLICTVWALNVFESKGFSVFGSKEKKTLKTSEHIDTHTHISCVQCRNPVKDMTR